MSDNHDALVGMAEAYVLGTLSDVEARTFAAHLSSCDQCRRETRDYALIAEALGRTVPDGTPPPTLRARVLAHATATAPVARPSVDVRDAIGERPQTAARPTRAGWLAVAASLVAIVMTGLAWQYRNEVKRARAEQQAVARQVSALEQQVAALESAAATAAQTRAVLSAGDLARVELAGQAAAPGANGRVFWSPTHGLVFAATNLPALPPGSVYQLWVVADAPISAGLARPGAAGDLGVVSQPSSPARPKAFALTIEPEGGRPAPTGAMYLLGAADGPGGR